MSSFIFININLQVTIRDPLHYSFLYFTMYIPPYQNNINIHWDRGETHGSGWYSQWQFGIWLLHDTLAELAIIAGVKVNNKAVDGPWQWSVLTRPQKTALQDDSVQLTIRHLSWLVPSMTWRQMPEPYPDGCRAHSSSRPCRSLSQASSSQVQLPCCRHQCRVHPNLRTHFQQTTYTVWWTATPRGAPYRTPRGVPYDTRIIPIMIKHMSAVDGTCCSSGYKLQSKL